MLGGIAACVAFLFPPHFSSSSLPWSLRDKNGIGYRRRSLFPFLSHCMLIHPVWWSPAVAVGNRGEVTRVGAIGRDGRRIKVWALFVMCGDA